MWWAISIHNRHIWAGINLKVHGTKLDVYNMISAYAIKLNTPQNSSKKYKKIIENQNVLY